MRTRTLVGVVAALAVLAAGVHAENAGFFRELREKQAATVLDGYRVALALLGQDYADVAFDEARAKLLEAGMIPGRWKKGSDETITRGELAYLIVKVLGIKGGLTMRVFGVSERYALRECKFENLMSGGMTSRHVTGRELVAVLARADEYRSGKLANAEVTVREVETPEKDETPEAPGGE